MTEGSDRPQYDRWLRNKGKDALDLAQFRAALAGLNSEAMQQVIETATEVWRILNTLRHGSGKIAPGRIDDLGDALANLRKENK